MKERTLSSGSPVHREYGLSEVVAGITPKNRKRETDWARRVRSRELVRPVRYVPKVAIFSGSHSI
jgi:hypothetical protein